MRTRWPLLFVLICLLVTACGDSPTATPTPKPATLDSFLNSGQELPADLVKEFSETQADNMKGNIPADFKVVLKAFPGEAAGLAQELYRLLMAENYRSRYGDTQLAPQQDEVGYFGFFIKSGSPDCWVMVYNLSSKMMPAINAKAPPEVKSVISLVCGSGLEKAYVGDLVSPTATPIATSR